MAPWLTFGSLNYPCLEQIFLVPKIFEPLKFDYMFRKELIEMELIC